MKFNCLKKNCASVDSIVAGGRQGANPHERGTGKLRAGSPIVIDIFPRHRRHGYWGDLTRTVSRGKPAPVILRAYRAVKTAQNLALDMIKPGIKSKSIHNRVREYLEKQGFPQIYDQGMPAGFIHGTGHGLGLEIHEAPSIGMGKGSLKTGNVITIEPGLYYPKWGGIRIEDTVAVTDTGFEFLAKFPKTFVV